MPVLGLGSPNHITSSEVSLISVSLLETPTESAHNAWILGMQQQPD